MIKNDDYGYLLLIMEGITMSKRLVVGIVSLSLLASLIIVTSVLSQSDKHIGLGSIESKSSQRVAKPSAYFYGGKTQVDPSELHLFLYNCQCGRNQCVVVYRQEGEVNPYETASSGISCTK